MSRLVVVSNRVALPKEVRAGGLASAMQAALAERGGLWFGWSGRRVDDDGERRLERHGADRVDYALLDLTREEYARYYLGFANRTLWPLLHFRSSLFEYDREDFTGYRRVNRLFAERLAPLLQPGDCVWVHDYHLIPLGAELRALGVDASIGFFLHVPLPPRELLAALPHHEHVFSALAAYDLVGVQTAPDLDALVAYFRAEHGADLDGEALRLPDGRRFRAGAFPIGIDTGRVARDAAHAVGGSATKRLVASLERRRLLIGVDRLDYSKGLPQRFEAFGRFLAAHPQWRSKASLLQIAPPSREDVPEYRELRSRLERIAGATNGRYAEPDWVPIRYVNRSFNQATLAGFHRVADVGLVTPLRDGMNLVAKEFVAAQLPEDPGVLVLSTLAGAARELEHAVLINPHDPDDIVEALETALAMPLAERRERWTAMIEHLRRHDITAWRNDFLRALDGAVIGGS